MAGKVTLPVCSSQVMACWLFVRAIDDDLRYAVWPSRVLADIYSANMEPEASLAKHAAECAALLTEQAHTDEVEQ